MTNGTLPTPCQVGSCFNKPDIDNILAALDVMDYWSTIHATPTKIKNREPLDSKTEINLLENRIAISEKINVKHTIPIDGTQAILWKYRFPHDNVNIWQSFIRLPPRFRENLR